MTKPNKKGMQVRLFAGVEIDRGLEYALKKSKTWHLESIWGGEHGEPLVEVDYQQKKYIGCYFVEHKPSMEEINELEKELLGAIARHCPKGTHENRNIQIFPQIFVA